MKFHLASAAGNNLFTGHGQTYVAVNNQRYEKPVIVAPDAVHQAWDIERFEELTAEHFRFLLQLEPEIVILGTGAQQRFPRPELMRDLIAARIGVEVMDTAAACRSYHILMAEGRKVIAAVLIA